VRRDERPGPRHPGSAVRRRPGHTSRIADRASCEPRHRPRATPLGPRLGTITTSQKSALYTVIKAAPAHSGTSPGLRSSAAWPRRCFSSSAAVSTCLCSSWSFRDRRGHHWARTCRCTFPSEQSSLSDEEDTLGAAALHRAGVPVVVVAPVRVGGLGWGNPLQPGLAV
jgi:hypothetical protein